MGVVGWILLLLSQIMVPVASQKPPGLSVGVIMGQTRPVADQELRPPRRPDDALDVSVVTLRTNQTDPKSVITQVSECVMFNTICPTLHTHMLVRDTGVCFCVPRCVSFCHARVSMALCSPMAPIRRPSPRSSTSCLFRHSFQSSESTAAPL